MPSDYSVSELMACIIARDLSNADQVAFGLYAQVGLAAAAIAQALYAPGLQIRHGLRIERGIELNPPAWTDKKFTRTPWLVEKVESHDLMLTLGNRSNPCRFCNVFFVGGMQIDQYGNTNLIGIKGEKGKMKVRGPGSIGTSSIAALVDKCYIFSFEHSKKRFVEKVDFVSVVGHDKGQGGPKWCLTPLGIFDFNPQGKMRLKSIHPGVSLKEIVEKTGFSIDLPQNPPVTPLPTKEELEILQKIDPEGELKALDRQVRI